MRPEKLALAKAWLEERFPEMRDIEPTLTELENSRYLLTLKKAFITEDGSRVVQVVRATVDEEGQVLKVSVSKG